MTGYTDASYSDHLGGGWAVWLRSHRGRVVRRGLCPPYVRDSTSAELAAIYAAVYLACQSWPGEVRGVLVRSDCQYAIALADPNTPLAKHKVLERLQLKLRDTLTEHGVELQATWVKGHRPKSAGTSAFLNDACDRLANAARKRHA